MTGNEHGVEGGDPLLGTTLMERYHVKQKLGEGGMGSVYLATHTTLQKDVALKVLHGEYSRKPELVGRFLQEARAASRIRHQNVIDITDFGTTPQGWAFFTMERLEGKDLHELLEEERLAGRRLSWQRTKAIFLQVCSALQAAHDMGIIHRDLKPENIYLIERGGSADFVKLLDFGIAKVTDEADSPPGTPKLTKTGMLFGTPEYMSPEQAKGLKPDHRVDIYAMGCILYQMIAGKTPFSADNFMSVLTKHLTEVPEPIAAETMADIGAPMEIGRVLSLSLAKERNDRYGSIQEMAEVIREVEQGLSLTSARAAVQAKSRKWLYLAMGGLVCAAAVGGYFAVNGKAEAKQEASATKQPAIVVEKVKITINSTPVGASVTDDKGELLGVTPWSGELAKSSERRNYTLALAGHSDKSVTFAPEEKTTFNEVLSKVPQVNIASSSSSAASKRVTSSSSTAKQTVKNSKKKGSKVKTAKSKSAKSKVAKPKSSKAPEWDPGTVGLPELKNPATQR